jgi:hypothetical protein
MIHVPEVLTVRDLHVVFHPYNVQGRRACQYTTLLSGGKYPNYDLEKKL